MDAPSSTAYGVVSSPIDWSEWHRINRDGGDVLQVREQEAQKEFDEIQEKLDVFSSKVHQAIVENKQKENARSAAAVHDVREMRQRLHVKEVEQKRLENARTIARLLQEGAVADNTSFNMTRADELREKEMAVAQRRSQLFKLKQSSQQYVVADPDPTSSSPAPATIRRSEQQRREDEDERQRIAAAAREEEGKNRIKEIESEEKLSVAVYELKRQARMKLEEDRLRRAADRAAAEAEGRACEQEFRFRRIVDKVQQQRQLYESKQLFLATLAEEGARLRGLKDREALAKLREEFMRHVTDIDTFLREPS